MIRKKIMRIFTLIFFFTVLFGVNDMGTYNVRAQGEIKEVLDEKQDLEKIQASIETILSLGTKKFYCGYNVDEAFLGWVNSTYGNKAIENIKDNLLLGNAKPEVWYTCTGNSIYALWDTYCRDKNYSSYNWDNTYWMKQKGKNIELDFIGDINFADDWYTMKYAKKQQGVSNCFSHELLNRLMNADITLVNNEFTFGDKGKALPGKTYTFRAAEENVSNYEYFGADIVSLANNHVYDFGEKGLKRTKEVLHNAGILTVGAGDNLEEASKTVYFIVGGRKIAIVSATEIERFSHFTKPATEKEAGVFKVMDTKLVNQRIKEAKAQSDFVFVYVHWGQEGTRYYDWQQIMEAKVFAKAGADLIIGGHPHRLQGVGYADNVPVLYSLGNFWFSTGTLYTTVANVKINDKGKLSVNFIPCVQKALRTSIITDEEAKADFFRYLCDSSKNIGFDKSGRIYNLDKVKDKGKIKYKSKDDFVYHKDDSDLDGVWIDIVGNRK